MSQVTQYPSAVASSNRFICTSSTRPSSPLDGWEIYETDTKNTLVYDSTLGWIAPWNTAWGRVAFASISSDQTPITTVTDATGYSITFTAVAGRRYKLSSYGLFSTTTADNVVRLDICNSSNTVLVRGTGHIVIANNGIAVSAMTFVTPSAGSVTYKCRTQRQGGSGTVTLASSVDNGFLSAEDVGPA